jgi:hypothetical protein
MQINFRKMITIVLATFLSLNLIDWLLHSNILASYYEETAYMWRNFSTFRGLISYKLLSYLGISLLYFYVFEIYSKHRGAHAILNLGTFLGALTGMYDVFTYALFPVSGWVVLTWFLAKLFHGIVAAAIYSTLD